MAHGGIRGQRMWFKSCGRKGFGVEGVMCLGSGCKKRFSVKLFTLPVTDKMHRHTHIPTFSSCFSFSVTLTEGHRQTHTDTQTQTHSLAMLFPILTLQMPPDLYPETREVREGYVDKSFPNEAKDSSEQVDLGDNSFCNSQHNFSPIFIKTTQPTVYPFKSF